jgi:hypothetical protein
VRKRDRDHEEQIIDSNDLGSFYKYINGRIGGRPSIGAIHDVNKIIDTDKEKANVFNSYFSSVGIADNGLLPLIEKNHSQSEMEAITITEMDVFMSIKKLKNKFTCGPDGLPPIFFKQRIGSLVIPLTIIFNQLLSVSAVPDAWKTAIITPVFKKGAAGQVSNYRPISLTSVPSKILERIISNKIIEHLNVNKILHPAQHGFRKGRSTCTNLLECLNDWTLYLQSGYGTIVIYVDFSKAFDVVSHRKLFARLQSYGINGTLLQWLRNFFTGRTHKTKVGFSLSDKADLISGIV